MQNEFTFPYRRFSSEMYAGSLMALLDEHQIPFQIISEPEGMGSALTGAATAPGIIIMLRPEDQQRVFLLEEKERPEVKSMNEKLLSDDEEHIGIGWIAFWFVIATFASPFSILRAYLIFSSRKRKRDSTFRYQYDAATRYRGKLIFWFAIFMLVFGFARLFLSPRAGFIDMVSVLGSYWRLR